MQRIPLLGLNTDMPNHPLLHFRSSQPQHYLLVTSLEGIPLPVPLLVQFMRTSGQQIPERLEQRLGSWRNRTAACENQLRRC
jgi:hypothetical protein